MATFRDVAAVSRRRTSRSDEAARLIAALVAAAALLVVAPTSAAAAGACASDADLDYVCGPEKPEDVVAIPGTRWLVASGFTAGGGLKLVDVRERSFTPWFTGARLQVEPDRTSFPNCPGPVDPLLFNARGLSLSAAGTDRWRLLVVNHGGRQTIEAFDIDTAAERPRLFWRGCQPMPDGHVGNAVASFIDGTILVTVLTRPGTTIADFVAGRPTGAVWRWRRGDPDFRQVAGTELPGNNGVETDPDNRHFYVVAFGLHAVIVFDRAAPDRSPVRIEAPDFMPDNIHWTDGRLLIAGMRLDEPACGGLRRIANGVADPMLCHRGWVVGEVDRAQGRVTTLAYGRPQSGVNGLSAAAIADGQLWLGSIQSSRLAVVRGWSLVETPAASGGPTQ